MTLAERYATATDPYLLGVWIQCAFCPDFVCVRHGMHVWECPCPPIEEWSQ